MSNDLTKSNTKQLTDMQKDFLHHLGTPECMGDIRKAMKAAGYSENTRTQEVIKGLKDQIREVAENLIAANAVKATMGMIDVLDNPARPMQGNKLNAAKEILDRIGIAKKTEDTGTKVKIDTIVILPSKEPIKTIEGVANQVQESIAPLIEINPNDADSLLTET